MFWFELFLVSRIDSYCFAISAVLCVFSRNFYVESESKGATVDHSDTKNIEGINFGFGN